MNTQAANDQMFDALTVISPALEDGQPKDQDRAAWISTPAIAAVADGVTTSPHGDKAAELCVQFAPALFEGDMTERLAGICDLLQIRRRSVQHGAINTSNLPPQYGIWWNRQLELAFPPPTKPRFRQRNSQPSTTAYMRTSSIAETPCSRLSRKKVNHC
ncbi:MAG: hypothetical protein HY287_15080 [Planctomycetes bacterium]|nr:hypothetical protein [Planctomycetota bacterium]